jgi:hypothetical protein
MADASDWWYTTLLREGWMTRDDYFQIVHSDCKEMDRQVFSIMRYRMNMSKQMYMKELIDVRDKATQHYTSMIAAFRSLGSPEDDMNFARYGIFLYKLIEYLNQELDAQL